MTDALPWRLVEAEYVNFRPLRHVIPVNDFKEHTVSIETCGDEFRSVCWCHPEIVDEFILAHRSMDGRESLEPDREDGEPRKLS